jgi:hypothetical protein
VPHWTAKHDEYLTKVWPTPVSEEDIVLGLSVLGGYFFTAADVRNRAVTLRLRRPDRYWSWIAAHRPRVAEANARREYRERNLRPDEGAKTQ